MHITANKTLARCYAQALETVWIVAQIYLLSVTLCSLSYANGLSYTGSLLSSSSECWHSLALSLEKVAGPCAKSCTNTKGRNIGYSKMCLRILF